ncbi:histidyl-tRNA synthetase [Ruminococcaceae bacterium FB2012]|nr:histidyl-tRNA synthetase [Ruminococcaceae bacterium FB2012]
MALLAKRPNGTQDVVPNEVYKWQTVESVVRDTAQQFGFREIRIPTFEETGLFVRSVGDTTDVVQKEMYTVSSSGDKTFTLRPEGTAGTIRAVIENGILNDGLPQKVYYTLSCFRHEKAQKGRLREFHQFGCELLGAASPSADADVIALADSVLKRLGLRNIVLNINSIGCPECRAKYREALKAYFEPHRSELCATCQDRLDKNPMRLLDCKSEEDQAIAKDAPLITDYLCEDCAAHFETVKKQLGIMGIDFTVNPKIVRGLDYYTRTVFEFISNDIGAQGTVCGGGRYDGLVETLGGKPTPALGFAMGLERILLTMEAQGCEFMEEKTCDLYIAAMGEAAAEKTVEIVTRMRDEGFFVEYDLVGRGLKAQMKYADKIKAKYVIVLGDSELESGSAKLKNMATGEQTDISLGEELLDDFGAQYYELMMSTDDDFRSFVEAFADNGDDK